MALLNFLSYVTLSNLTFYHPTLSGFRLIPTKLLNRLCFVSSCFSCVIRPLSVKFSRPSFLIMRFKTFYCLFQIVNIFPCSYYFTQDFIVALILSLLFSRTISIYLCPPKFLVQLCSNSPIFIVLYF